MEAGGIGMWWILIPIGACFLIGGAAGLLLRPQSRERPREQRIVVHVHNHPPRPRRESAYRRVKRRQEAERRAYRESEWRRYGGRW